MSGMLRKGMSWLGLGPDDGYDGYDDYDDYDDDDVYYDEPQVAPAPSNPVVRAVPNPAQRGAGPRSGGARGPSQRAASSRVEPDDDWGDSAEPSADRVLSTAARTTTSAEPVRPRSSAVRPIPATPASARPHTVTPSSFNDAQEVGDHFKKNQPVIVILNELDRGLARRMLDFSSGVAYGLGGSVERLAASVYLLTPADVELSSEERRRLRERGILDD